MRGAARLTATGVAGPCGLVISCVALSGAGYRENACSTPGVFYLIAAQAITNTVTSGYPSLSRSRSIGSLSMLTTKET